jgi:lysophospholipase L1-like esterase
MKKIFIILVLISAVFSSCSKNDSELEEENIPHNTLKGRKLSVLGDSFSTYDGEIPKDHETWYRTSTIPLSAMWWEKLLLDTEMEKEIISAWSGSRISTGYSDSRVPMCDESRLSNLGNPDIIILFGGINDWRYNCQLGDYYPGSGDYDLTKFRQAYEYVLCELILRYPKALLFACTMTQNGRISEAPTFPQYKSSVGYLYDYAESIKYLCEIYNVTCIDLFEKSGITYWNAQAGADNVPTENNTKTFDGLHPNIEGMKDIYNLVIKTLVSMTI